MKTALKHFYLPSSLSGRLSLYTALGIIIVALILGTTTHLFLSEILYQNIKDKYESLSKQLSAVTLDAVLIKDYSVIERYSKQIVQDNPDITQLTILGQHQEVLANIKRETPNLQKNSFTIIMPISLTDYPIGKVRLTISLQSVKETLFNIFLVALIGLITLFIFLFWIIHYIIKKQLIQPLTPLLSSLENIESTLNNTPTLPKSASREIQLIYLSFSKLQQELKNHIQLLEKAQQATQQLCKDQHLASIDKISAGLAHDLNTPLANILGYCQLCQEWATEHSNDEILSYLNIIERQTQLSSEIVTNLLNHARSPIPNLDQQPLVPFLEKIISLLTPITQAKGLKQLQMQQDALEEVKVQMHTSNLQQVFFNLINNAIEADATLIKFTVSEEEKMLVVNIEDNGTGIPADQIDYIFDAFYSNKPHQKGTGFGLFLAKEYLHKMDGDIQIVHSDHHGSRFKILLQKVAEA